MKQEIDNNLLADCFKAAMNVEFLHTSEEIKLWAYPCIMQKYGEEA